MQASDGGGLHQGKKEQDGGVSELEWTVPCGCEKETMEREEAGRCQDLVWVLGSWGCWRRSRIIRRDEVHHGHAGFEVLRCSREQ